MLVRRALAAVAGALLAGSAAVAAAPVALATGHPSGTATRHGAAADGCKGLQVQRVEDTLHLTLDKGCEAIELNVSTYQLPDAYDRSGKRNDSAYPMKFRDNHRVTLDHEHADTVVYIDVAKCAWCAYDVYTGNVVEHPSTKGRDGFLSGAIVHHAKCDKNKGGATHEGSGKPEHPDQSETPAPATQQPTPAADEVTASPAGAGQVDAVDEADEASEAAPVVVAVEEAEAQVVEAAPAVVPASAQAPQVAGVSLAALPRTGVTVAPYLLGAIVLLGLGVVLVRAGKVPYARKH